MLTLHSFLQTVYQFVKSLVIRVTKRMYRHSAVFFTSGAAVLMVVALTATGFGGGGRSALTAYAETPAAEEESEEEEPESEEIELFTEAKIQASLSEVQSSGQLLIGSRLVEEVLKEQEYQKKEEERTERTKEELRRIEEEKARIAAEEEARRKEEEARKAAAVVNYSEKDYQVLLRIVQAEAGICDEEGKLLVANVILNRVRDPEFPDTITEVVYQPSQFSPVSNGSINTCKVTQETEECVNRALAGEDISRGALYFMYRGGSKSHNVRWFDRSLTFLFRHEHHEFFK